MNSVYINIIAAWLAMLAGIVAGAIQGLFFHRREWLGGYDSWERRITRLGHISLFGIAFINLAFAFSVITLDIQDNVVLTSWLFLIGQITMPVICYLSALKKPLRNLFFIPVLSILAGTIIFITGGLIK